MSISVERIKSVWTFSDSKEKELEALLDLYGLEHELGKKIFIDDYADLAILTSMKMMKGITSKRYNMRGTSLLFVCMNFLNGTGNRHT